MLAVVASMATVTSCGEESNFLQSVQPAEGARLKFYHAASDAPGVEIIINDKKFSGTNTTTAPIALTYFSSYPNLDYGLVIPGTAKVKVALAATPTVAVLSTDLPVEDGKYYSIYAYGVSPTYGALVLNDNLTPPDRNKAYVRLVNLVAGTPAPKYDLAVNGVVIAAGIDVASTKGDFIGIDAITYSGTAIPIQLRAAGTTTAVASGTLQPYAGKFYTFIARGVVGGTGTKVITLSTSTNK